MQHWGLFCSSSHQRGDCGCTRFGRGHSCGSWPQVTQGLSPTMWHHAQQIKLKGRRRKGDVQSDGICLAKSLLHVRGPAPLRVAEQLLVHGKWWISSLFCLLMCVAFAHLLTCLYLNPWVFSLLPFLFFPSISLLIEQLEGLSYQLGLNCDKNPIPVPGLPRICSAGVTLPLQPLLLLPTADVLKSCIRVGVWSRLELILRDLPRFPQQFYELSRI